MPSKPKLVRIKIKRQDGIIQRIRVKGRKRALQHPLRVDRKGRYLYPETYAPNVPRAPEPSRTPAPATSPQPAPTVATTPTIVAPRRRTGAKYHTWFRAAGSRLSDAGSFKDHYEAGVMDEINEDFPAPSMWFSNQAGLLGQVKFDGIIDLEHFIDQLNVKLQYYGESIEGFDFRTYYDKWEYKYQIIETIGLTAEVIQEQRDSKG